jgi:Peptidase propeptide and YPEB domain
VTFLFAQTCQKDQIRISKEQAISTAKRQVDFRPTRVYVRMVRQGLQSRPNWIVSLSIPRREASAQELQFKELALVRIDANTGKVINVQVQR